MQEKITGIESSIIRKALRIQRYESLEKVIKVLVNNTDMNPQIGELINLFITEVLFISKYMLVERFDPSSTRKEKFSRHANDDVMKIDFLGSGIIPPRPRKFNALDVIKAFKELEQYCYHDRWVTQDSSLELGKLSESYANLLRLLPKLILEAKEERDLVQKRKVLSIVHSTICVYRHFSTKAIADISTVTGPYTGKISLEDAEKTHFSDEQIDSWLDTIPNLNQVKEFFRLQIYSGNASSPAGGSHDANLLQDVNAIWRDFDIRDAIKRMSKHFAGGKDFILLVDNLFANTAWDKTFPLTKASRVCTFTAPGGKARTIVIADWVTQTALSAIHFGSFQVLKLLSSDRTFSHTTGLDLFRGKTENFYSLDLSAATDRMPRRLQSRIIARLLTKLGQDGDEIANDWLTITDRGYDTRGSSYERITPELRYVVGNGMGLFSSWTTMALTHHYLVSLTGCDISEYRMVGDDLLIRGNRAAYDKYIAIMSDIGVNVNTKKTIVSEDAPPTIEFARNWIIDGVRITPIRFGVLFAWIDKAVTAETVIWHLRDWLTMTNIQEIMDILGTGNSLLSKMQIYYYLYRENIATNAATASFLKSVSEFKHYDIDLLSRIKQVTASARLKIATKDKIIRGFYDTLLSQCIVRKPEELNFVVNFATNISMIAFADERLVEPAEKFHRRAMDANLIKYDVDLKGGPLLTRRERKLIYDLLVRDKVIVDNPEILKPDPPPFQ